MGWGCDDYYAISGKNSAGYKTLERIQENVIVLVDMNEMFAGGDFAPKDFRLI